MNKQKKLKLILSSLKEKQLIKFFEIFLDVSKCKFYKAVKQISFSCFQSTCQVENFVVNGYGKTSSEALLSGINNLIDCLVEEEEHCEVMKQCLKKFNVSPYSLANNGTTSKKQLLSTQKTMKTLGPQSSISLQKKVLTMSASLSSNSKTSSSKAKSIKEEIFEYFNLQNLKVKNPNQAFTSVSPLAANSKIPKRIDTFQSGNFGTGKQKYGPNQVQVNSVAGDKQLQLIYKRIRQIKEQISAAQKQNFTLKQQVQKKKHSTKFTQPNQYFTRPSLETKPSKKVNAPMNTQSSKKLSYLEMSLNDKLLMKHGDKENVNVKKGKYENTNENYFQNVEIPTSFKMGGKGYEGDSMNKSTTIQNGAVIAKPMQQRKCLVDISNLKPSSNEISKMSEYATVDANTKGAQKHSSAFQTVNNYTQGNERLACNSILYPKAAQQQQSLSIIESSKKLRSFSVQNTLTDKISYGTTAKHQAPPSVTANNMNMNASFDNALIGVPQKKIKIPKLNLQILPNYHGKSNKSLNQSLMENYEKKNQFINAINE